MSKLEILLVEDNPADVGLFKEALRMTGRNIQVHVIEDGESALIYLKKMKNDHTQYPQLIFLDLNLPKKNGIEVLREIKGNDISRKIPVIILTSSKDSKDINQTYDLHANCFVSKPQELEEFISAIDGITKFWFDVAKTPDSYAV